MMMALGCDFRLMTAHRGMMSMNEIFLGVPLPNSFNTWLRLRLTPVALRDTLLGKRWVQADLLKHGIIDEIVDDAPPNQGALIERAIKLGQLEGQKSALGAWGTIKDGVYHEVIESSQSMRMLRRPEGIAKAFHDRLVRQGKADLAAKL
jgi:enoyl-CoA hydratase/carnithine racemase